MGALQARFDKWLMSALPPKIVFNAGEVDPLIDSRFDLNSYRFGCKLLENFRATPYGPVSFRPGTNYLGECKSECRMLPFIYSETTAYRIEAGENYFRFWSPGLVDSPTGTAWTTTTVQAVGDIVTESSNVYYCLQAHTAGTFATDLANGLWLLLGTESGPLELVSPYTLAEIREVDFYAVGDIVYLAHPDHEFAKLVRTAADVWIFQEIDWDYPPLRTANIESGQTIASSGTAAGATVTLTATGFTFEDSGALVGGYYEILHRVDGRAEELNLHSTAAASAIQSSAVKMTGAWSVVTNERWWGTLEIQRSYDNSNWETIKTLKSFSNYNAIVTGEESEVVWLRLQFTAAGDAYGTSSGEPFYMNGTSPAVPTSWVEATAKLEVDEALIGGFVKITAVASGGATATAVVKTVLQATSATQYWAEGAFSDYRGHPRTVSLINGSLVLVGNLDEQNRLWESEADNFEYFKYGTDADSAFRVTLKGQRNPVQWIKENRGALLVGTTGDEKAIVGPNDEPFSAANLPNVKTGSGYGSSRLPAQDVDDVVIFVQAGGKKVREFVYSFEKDGYTSVDLTRISKSITGPGIVDVGIARNPDNQWLGVRSDGQLAVLVYERAEQVVAWSRWKLRDGDNIVSVAVVPDGTGNDSIGIVTERSINGATKYYLETVDQENWYDEDNPDDISDAVYLDASDSFSLLTGIIDNVQLIELGETSLYGYPGADPFVGYRWRVETTAAHGLVTGDFVVLEDTGFEALNGVVCRVLKGSNTVFNLLSISDVFTVTDLQNTGAMPANSGSDAYSNAQVTFDSSTPIGLLPRSGFFYDVGGMSDVNGLHVNLINDVAGDIFLDGIDSGAYGAYTSGGFFAGPPTLLDSYESLTVGTQNGGTFKQVQNTINASTWLEGEEIRGLADGSVVEMAAAVSSGVATLADGVYANKLVWGIPYRGRGRTMKIDLVTPQGSSRGRKTQVTDIVVNLYRTSGGQVGLEFNKLRDIHRRKFSDLSDKNQSPLNDEVIVPIPGNTKNFVSICWEQNDPLPMTISALIPKIQSSFD